MKNEKENEFGNMEGDLTDVIPMTTPEMVEKIGHEIFCSFNIYEDLTICGDLLKNVIDKGSANDKAKLRNLLANFNIRLIYNDGGTISGLDYNAAKDNKIVMDKYEVFSPEYSICCVFIGKLQERMNNYQSGNFKDLDINEQIMLLVSKKIAEESTPSVCLDRIGEIIDSHSKN